MPIVLAWQLLLLIIHDLNQTNDERIHMLKELNQKFKKSVLVFHACQVEIKHCLIHNTCRDRSSFNKILTLETKAFFTIISDFFK